jgi:hypothetical protein
MNEPQRNIPATAPTPPAPHEVDGMPRNPDVAYERTDVDSRAVIWFVVALAVALAVTMLILWGMFRLFMGTEEVRKKSTFPMAVETRRQLLPEQRLPPQPRLEGLGPIDPDENIGRMRTTDIAPEQDVGRFRLGGAAALYREQDAQLSSYGWVDGSEKKMAHIPVDEAIARLADKLPARKGEDVPKDSGPPSRSSSGRVPREGGR